MVDVVSWRNISGFWQWTFSGPVVVFLFPKSVVERHKETHVVGPNMKIHGGDWYFILPSETFGAEFLGPPSMHSNVGKVQISIKLI